MENSNRVNRLDKQLRLAVNAWESRNEPMIIKARVTHVFLSILTRDYNFSKAYAMLQSVKTENAAAYKRAKKDLFLAMAEVIDKEFTTTAVLSFEEYLFVRLMLEDADGHKKVQLQAGLKTDGKVVTAERFSLVSFVDIGHDYLNELTSRKDKIRELIYLTTQITIQSSDLCLSKLLRSLNTPPRLPSSSQETSIG